MRKGALGGAGLREGLQGWEGREVGGGAQEALEAATKMSL